MTLPENKNSKQTTADPQAEIEQLKERLAFYESFDQIIQQQVSQSSELLREASKSKEEANLLVESERLRLNAERDIDLDHYRSLFSSLLDEITQLQTQAEHLAVTISDAVDDIELKSPASRSLPGIPEFPHDAFPDADSVPPNQIIPPPQFEKALAEDTAGVESQVDQDREIAEASAADSTELSPLSEERSLSERMLLVHGLPESSAALSFKRFVETIPGVLKVEPRELTGGLLRLQVRTNRKLTSVDFEGWEHANSLQPGRSTGEMLELTWRNNN